jgi:hypothetical protein
MLNARHIPDEHHPIDSDKALLFGSAECSRGLVDVSMVTAGLRLALPLQLAEFALLQIVLLNLMPNILKDKMCLLVRIMPTHAMPLGTN